MPWFAPRPAPILSRNAKGLDNALLMLVGAVYRPGYMGAAGLDVYAVVTPKGTRMGSRKDSNMNEERWPSG